MISACHRASTAPGEWDDFVSAHPLGWFWHTSGWLDYQLAYLPSNADVSFALRDEESGSLCAVVPGVVSMPKTTACRGVAAGVAAGPEFSFSGEPTPRLLTMRSGLYPIISLERDRLAVEHRVSRGAWCASAFEEMPTTSSAYSQRVVDLAPDATTLWRSVRSSYRSLINRALDKYGLVVGEDAWNIYARLHRSLYNTPRSQATYDLQERWRSMGHGMAVAIGDVGAAYWIIFKGSAYYASGAYARPNVAHAAVWLSLITLRARDVRLASLGWQGRALSEKERAIEFFKRGFGGRDVPVAIWECDYRLIDPTKLPLL